MTAARVMTKKSVTITAFAI